MYFKLKADFIKGYEKTSIHKLSLHFDKKLCLDFFEFFGTKNLDNFIDIILAALIYLHIIPTHTIFE